MSERLPKAARSEEERAAVESAEHERLVSRGELVSLRRDGVPESIRAVVEQHFGGAARALYVESGDDENEPCIWLAPADVSREEAERFDPADFPGELIGKVHTCEMRYLERTLH